MLLISKEQIERWIKEEGLKFGDQRSIDLRDLYVCASIKEDLDKKRIICPECREDLEVFDIDLKTGICLLRTDDECHEYLRCNFEGKFIRR